MAEDSPSNAAPADIVVVADGVELVQAVVARLGDEFAGRVRPVADGGSADALEAVAACGATVLVLGASTLADTERWARGLREHPGAAASILVALCSAEEAAEAAGLASGGIVDDYVVHPSADDPARLATSVRLAVRLAATPSAAAEDGAPERERPMVLMVEDDPLIHQLVSFAMESREIDLVVVTHGDTALERIRSSRPDLVLMDIRLPGHDGVELTRELKMDPAFTNMPVVMLTGEARRETLVRSMEAGASDFVVKPFTADALLAKLGRYLPGLRSR